MHSLVLTVCIICNFYFSGLSLSTFCLFIWKRCINFNFLTATLGKLCAVMSCHDSMGIVLKCLSEGAADFLVKPIRKNELKNLWQHVWRRCHSVSFCHSPDFCEIRCSTQTANWFLTLLLYKFFQLEFEVLFSLYLLPAHFVIRRKIMLL